MRLRPLLLTAVAVVLATAALTLAYNAVAPVTLQNGQVTKPASTCAQETNLPCLAGRTGATNDLTLSTDGTGALYGSAAGGQVLRLYASSALGGGEGIEIRTGSGGVSIIASPTTDAPFLRLWSQLDSHYTQFTTSQSQTGQLSYIYPLTAPTQDSAVLASTTAGQLSWDNRPNFLMAATLKASFGGL